MFNLKYVSHLLLINWKERIGRIVRLTTATLIVKCLTLCPPILIGKLIDSIIQNTSGNFELYLFSLLSAWLVLSLLQPRQVAWQSEWIQHIVKAKTLEWYQSLFQKELNFFQNQSSARVTNILHRSIVAHETLLHQIVDVIIPVLVESIVLSVFVLKYGGLWCWAVGLIMIIVQMERTLRAVRSRRADINELNEIEDTQAENSNELLRVGKLFQLYQAQAIALKRLKHDCDEYAQSATKVSLSGAKLTLIPFHFQLIAQIFVLIWVCFQQNSHHISAGEIVALMSLLARFAGSTGETVSALRYLDQFQIDIQELNGLLNMPNLQRSGEIIDNPKSITLCNSGSEAIKLSAGMRVAIVGPTGGGKSTLLNKWAGLTPEDRDKFVVDGIPLSKVSSETQTQLIRFSTQEPLIFPGTLSENLLLDSNERLPDDILLRFQLTNFVIRKNDVLTSSNISGGEAKRLSLVRSLIHKGAIYFMDEPTSGLDEQTSVQVWQEIFKSTKDKVLICVTHDLSILSSFHHVIRVEQINHLEAL